MQRDSRTPTRRCNNKEPQTSVCAAPANANHHASHKVHPLLGVGFLALFVTITFAGCRKSDAPPSDAQAKPIEQTVERGPVKMTVRVDKNRITIAEKLNLSIEVTAAEGVDVEMPAFGEKLDEFQIRDYRDEPDIPTAQGRRWRQEYVLDIFLSGDYHIPPITARFTDRRAEREAATTQPTTSEVSSSPLTIKVTSLLEGEFDPADFCDIKGVVELPVPPGRAWIWWLTGSAAVVALAVAGLLLWKRHVRVAAERIIPPHEWAREQFQRLRDEHLIEQNQVRLFYYRLTGIVRLYIERRFAIMASEQTTDEFLRAVKGHPSLGTKYRGALSAFLRAGDMVKFARYTPVATEIDQAFEAAETFVEQTANTERNAQEAAA